MLNAASLKKLAKVDPSLVKVSERASDITKQPFQIVQGNRTQAEQNALYAQGRTKPGKIVTWTKASKHIGGRAVDFAALINGKINWDTKYYPVIAAAFKQAAKELGIGVEWGGDWKTKDWGHMQLAPKGATAKAPSAGIGWSLPDIQSALLKQGFDPGTVDGILGRKTRAALLAFQRARGLEQTGGPNKATLDALAAKPGPGAPMGLLAASPEPVILNKTTGQPVVPPHDAEWAIEYLESLGWSHLQAVALAANLVWESGGRQGNIIWSAHGDKGKDGLYHSHGAPQWNDRHGRWQKYLAYAKKRGTDWTDPESQLSYIDQELRTTEKSAAKKLQSAMTLKDAVSAALTFWRPSIPHADKRQAIAEMLNQEVSHA